MENLVRIENLADGPRDYPLKNGESIYLEPKGKRTIPVYVSPEVISEALLKAEKKGLVKIERPEVTPAEKSEKKEKEAKK